MGIGYIISKDVKEICRSSANLFFYGHNDIKRYPIENMPLSTALVHDGKGKEEDYYSSNNLTDRMKMSFLISL